MSKRDKDVAKLHGELKDKENSLKSKIKNAMDEGEKAKFIDELCEVQCRLRRGAPYFNKDYYGKLETPAATP
jgi:hypothetical protein